MLAKTVTPGGQASSVTACRGVQLQMGGKVDFIEQVVCVQRPEGENEPCGLLRKGRSRRRERRGPGSAQGSLQQCAVWRPVDCPRPGDRCGGPGQAGAQEGGRQWADSGTV